jgi:hypothetical protein
VLIQTARTTTWIKTASEQVVRPAPHAVAHRNRR